MKITSPTENTKAIRYQLYLDAIEILKNEQELKRESMGICKAIYTSYLSHLEGYENNSFCPYTNLKAYKELYDYKIENNVNPIFYWFPLNDTGNQKRIEILTSIVKDMELKLKKKPENN